MSKHLPIAKIFKLHNVRNIGLIVVLSIIHYGLATGLCQLEIANFT